MLFHTVSVIGGDLRQTVLAEELRKDGYHVTVTCFDLCEKPPVSHVPLSESLQSEAIILPLPISGDNHLLNAPLSSESVPLETIWRVLTSKQFLFGGHLTQDLSAELTAHHLLCRDYAAREEFSIANAVPTAEAAIELALSELPYTLCESRCLITGFGRIGKVLAHRLHAMGAEVSVSARNYGDLAWIRAYGYHALQTNALSGKVGDFDLIFNTVPHPIFVRPLLAECNACTLMIDLASKPGGVDFSAAQALGIRTMQALGLPGKSAPITSGKIIKESITNMLKEMEET